MYKCTECLEFKTADHFHKQKSRKCGYQCYCKPCKSKKLQEYKISKLEKSITITEKSCSDCSEVKSIDQFNFNPLAKDNHETRCKHCQSLYSKEYRTKNKDDLSIKNKEYYIENSDYIKQKTREYALANPDKIRVGALKSYHRRVKSDPLFKLMCCIRGRLNTAIKTTGLLKNSRTLDYIGCDILFFKNYIEDKFLEGMTWENHGIYGWHIDHIIPISSAKNEEDLYKLNHYTNLQPLWAIDNLKKSNKMPENVNVN